MKIVIPDKKTLTDNNDVSFDEIERLGEVVSYDLTPYNILAERIGDAEAVLCNKALITEDVIRSCPNLRYIGLFATGWNNIDIEAATKNKIVVSNAGEYSTMAVAQHVFALLLEFYSKISEYNASVKKGDWERVDTFSYFLSPTYELVGRTIGIVGFGSIGKAVAKIADAFGMNVLVNTRTLPGNSQYKFVTKEQLFSESDVISLHCPLNEETKGMVNRDMLSLCRKNAILINTSRGGTVVEQDLADALNTGAIAGAGLDVAEKEPMCGSPLKTADNCIITPHVAWAPRQTRQRLISIVADNLKCFIEGDPKNMVNHF